MIHVDPASHHFTTLPKYQQARIYRATGWTTAAIADEMDISKDTVGYYCSPRYERDRTRKLARRKTEAGRIKRREQDRRRRAKMKEAA